MQSDGPLRGQAYHDACRSFLETALSQPDEDRQELLDVLSNLMDLTTVSDMIARRVKPDLLKLQRQQYELMADDYRKINVGEAFPLKQFSEEVYTMRLEDLREIPAERFGPALSCMERFKMVLRREEASTRWLFRHDRVMDFWFSRFGVPVTKGPESI